MTLRRKTAPRGPQDGAPALKPPARGPQAPLSPTQAVPTGAGRPLTASERAPVEAGLARDFSRVRLHSGTEAAARAQALDARAYSVGDHVVLGKGAPEPHTPEGRHLLAHELAHVAQPKEGSGVSAPGDASEREAHQAADQIARGQRASVGTAGAPIQRQPAGGTEAPPTPAPGDALLEGASPMLASALGSTVLDHFVTGKADLTDQHRKELASVARNMQVLMRKYTRSTVAVIGHADTVGTDDKNMALGTARAEAVKQALIKLGIREEIISAESKGEGAPQLKATKDEVPSAQNRGVEVRFRAEASPIGPILPPLQPKAPAKDTPEAPEAPKKPIDLKYHPKLDPPDPTHLPPDFWKPIPPAPKGSGPKSPLDVIGEKVLDPVIDAVAGGLPKSMRDKIKEGARDAVKKGVAKGARAAAESAGLKDPQGLEAIEKAAEAAIQEKGQGQP